MISESQAISDDQHARDHTILNLESADYRVFSLPGGGEREFYPDPSLSLGNAQGSDSGQTLGRLPSRESEFEPDHGASYHSSCAKEAFFGPERELVPSPLLWLNQAVVAVLTAVEQVQPFRVGVHEKKEIVPQKLHLAHSFIYRHGLD